MKCTTKFREHPLPRRQAPSTLPRTLTRCLSGPQERVQRHFVEQLVEPVRGVPVLDAPVPQLVDKLEDVLKIVDLLVPVQEIEVPKISSLSRPPLRRALPVPQTAEQLVDVQLALGTDADGRVWTCVWKAVHRGLLVPGRHQAHPVDPPGFVHRQPRAVYK